MANPFHIDVDHVQQFKHGHLVCGDAFLSRRIKEENRTVAVLSDGLGSGVKANVLATLTASMAVNFTLAKQQVERTARIIMETLPVDSERQISYATFTIADIEGDGETRIIEFDNPQWVLLRRGRAVPVERQSLGITLSDGTQRQMHIAHLHLGIDDRIVMVSDGVTQSGMGTAPLPLGLGDEGLQRLVEQQVEARPDISSHELAERVVRRALVNDIYRAQDDTTCAVIHCRRPRRLLLCSGPPFDERNDSLLADIVRRFEGRKIVCGGTTSLILARELGTEVEVGLEVDRSGLPPASRMEGFDLVTEGILTVGRVAEMLKNMRSTNIAETGPAADILRLMLDSDVIHLLVGTKINIAHQDPSLPVELEIRRNVMRNIALLLEEKFLKQVVLQYI